MLNIRCFYLLFCLSLVSCKTVVSDIVFYEKFDRNENSLRTASKEDKEWYQTLTNSGYLTDEFITSDDGFKLHALNVKSAKPSKKVVITVHGFHREAVHQLFKYGNIFWKDYGYNVFIPDLRNSGSSEGDTTGWGWLDRKDMLLWINQVIQIYGRDCEIILHGLSMGAATVIMTASENIPRNVKCVISDSSYSSFEELLNSQLNKYRQDTKENKKFVDDINKEFQADGGFDLRDTTVTESIKKARIPILFIHSELDWLAPVWMMYELYLSKPEPKEYWRLPLANHDTIVNVYHDEYRDRVLQFIKKWTD